MDKQRIINDRTREDHIKINHPSGLTVFLYPMEGYSSAYAIFGTKYGSIDRCFKTEGDSEFIEVPDGIAHFLEHKLFENEDGDAFDLFAKTGASANAFTSFDRTCYLFSCTDNFEESLKILLSFVRAPYFSAETVQKEQGIIGQEIRMYQDDPGWRSFFGLLGALYKEHPVKIDIAGTEESIADITPEILFDCYNTFYNLNNMALAIAGNFDSDIALDIINDIIKPDPDKTIQRADYNEGEDIAAPLVKAELEVSMPLFTCGYKLAPAQGADAVKKELEANIIAESLIGDDSAFYRRLYDEGLINASFGSDVMHGNGYFILMFSGESHDPERVFSEIKKEIEKARETGIAQEDFDRVKKRVYGEAIRSFNSVDKVANNLIFTHFSGITIYDKIEMTAKLTVGDVNQTLGDIKEEQSAISIINPVKV